MSVEGEHNGIIGRKWGYIDKTGKIAIPFQDGLTGAPFSSELSVRYRGGVTTLYDKTGFPIMRETPFEGAFINKKENWLLSILKCKTFKDLETDIALLRIKQVGKV